MRNPKGSSAGSNREAASSSTFQQQSRPWSTRFKEQLITNYAFNLHVVLPIFVVCLSADLICGMKVAASTGIIVNTANEWHQTAMFIVSRLGDVIYV